MSTEVTQIDADTLNDHLRKGGTVTVATYTRATLYKAKHAGMFYSDKAGDLHVQHGRGSNCLTQGNGSRLLVSITLSAPIGGAS